MQGWSRPGCFLFCIFTSNNMFPIHGQVLARFAYLFYITYYYSLFWLYFSKYIGYSVIYSVEKFHRRNFLPKSITYMHTDIKYIHSLLTQTSPASKEGQHHDQGIYRRQRRDHRTAHPPAADIATGHYPAHPARGAAKERCSPTSCFERMRHCISLPAGRSGKTGRCPCDQSGHGDH